jgi:hypothetical protein
MVPDLLGSNVIILEVNIAGFVEEDFENSLCIIGTILGFTIDIVDDASITWTDELVSTLSVVSKTALVFVVGEETFHNLFLSA